MAEPVIIKYERTTEVLSKPASQQVAIIQSASPLPIASGEVADPGDLNLIFENKLI